MDWVCDGTSDSEEVGELYALRYHHSDGDESEDEVYRPANDVEGPIERLFLKAKLQQLVVVGGREKDLLSVSRTSKLFSQTLLSPSARTVWEASRERFGAPEPLSTFSEPRWASLLFDAWRQACGTKGLPKVDFQLAMRVCNGCKKVNLGRHDDYIKDKFPAEVLQYIPYANYSHYCGGHPRDDKYYWDDHANKCKAAWDDLQLGIQTAQTGGEAALEIFKKECEELVSEMQRVIFLLVISPSVLTGVTLNREHKTAMTGSKAGIFKELASLKANGYRGLKRELVYPATARSTINMAVAITGRFKQYGYTDEDLSILSTSDPGIESGTPNVTDRVWKLVRHKLEGIVYERRQRRLYGEKRVLVGFRKEKLKDLYSLKSEPHSRPQELLYYPIALELFELPAVSKLAHDAVRHMNNALPASFSLLDTEETAKALRLEATCALDAEVWCCNHCTLVTLRCKQNVLDHLEARHRVKPGIQDVDFFLNEDTRMELENPVSIPITNLPTREDAEVLVESESRKVIACMHCAGDKSDRRYTFWQVKKHLVSAHQLVYVRDEVDYKYDPPYDNTVADILLFCQGFMISNVPTSYQSSLINLSSAHM
ncbi:hypothetical protein FA15DRAFT_753997 [Coprinopsis marcescibilis]|uniref:Uncharacterized protein n=1 Tax=Coprinopsis marcescibilis TaxID=230819 RepID=A0A5C3L532_COPMA|nr:hypothetical protein FA15DRAFT_753997 [Coprinopsis marcescibilis]